MVRSVSWTPVAVAALLSTVIVAVRHGQSAAGPMQATALLIAAGVGFTLDDPAADLLAASPTPLWRRRSQRLALVLPATALLWFLLMSWQGAADSDEVWALGLLFAGLVALSLAIAGVAGRTSWLPGRGGLAAPPAILILVFLSTALPPNLRPLPFGDLPGGWTQIDIRWATTAVIAAAVFCLSSRDPAARSRARRHARGFGAQPSSLDRPE